jgi:hypothetical protein
VGDGTQDAACLSLMTGKSMGMLLAAVRDSEMAELWHDALRRNQDNLHK